jgi:hypothetical protein
MYTLIDISGAQTKTPMVRDCFYNISLHYGLS